MILTVTLNPSIDVSYPLEHLTVDGVSRVTDVSKTPGGKGLNVSRVLKQLDADVLTTGFIGGHFGAFITSELDKINLAHDYQSIDGETRTCIAILHDDGNQTEILEPGPAISESEAADFKHKFEDLVKDASIVTLSGSLPKGLDKTYYSDLIAIADQHDVKVLLDTSGETLEASVAGEHKPFLIKPNESEVTAIIHQELDLDELDDLKVKLAHDSLAGIKWIIISLGKDGAVAKHNDQFYRVTIPTVEAVNPVGSGDSTIAGFAKAIDDQASDETILKTGMTAGILNALSPKTGDVNPDQFDDIFNQVTVTTF